MTTTIIDQAHQGLLRWLASNQVEHEVHEHGRTYTAQGTARAEGVDPATFAKVVGVGTDDGRSILLVLDATDHVDLRKARQALEARDVRILKEEELLALAPDCEAGAIPAVGALFGLPMYADYGVREDAAISFNAGSHRHTVRVDRPGWERATGVQYADLAEELDARPVWANS
jgi:Ala-tRNA(Pro) deacylase